MKIRKLIFSAKLEQIEKQNKNIFIFHCSANASQWRFFKNFLFFYGQRVLANKTSELRALEALSSPKALLAPDVGGLWVSPLYQARSTDSSSSSQPTTAEITDLRQHEAPCVLRGYTYFQSTRKNPVKVPNSLKHAGRLRRRANSKMRGSDSEDPVVFATKKAVNAVAGQKVARKALLAVLPHFSALAKRAGSPPVATPGSGYRPSEVANSTGPLAPPPSPAKRLTSAELSGTPGKGTKQTGLHTSLSQKSLNKNFRPKGCLFFFDTRSRKAPFESHQKKMLPDAKRLELVNKTLRALEFNNNLLLLYGQMNSTVVNHVDIKETLILDAQATYQQLFLSMHSLNIGLNFCLHQKIDEFFCVQETNLAQSA